LTIFPIFAARTRVEKASEAATSRSRKHVTSRDQVFVYFCAVARVDKVLGSSNFGNMPDVRGNYLG
jgi:hypothetical protein